MHGTPPPAAGRGLLLLRNVLSGTAVIRVDPAPMLEERLSAARVHALAEGEDMAEVVSRAMESDDPPAALGVYGGDGSVSRMAGLARRFDRPLLVLPGGTFNHFARSAGIEDVDAGLDAFEAGELIPISAIEGSADDAEPFLAVNAVSVGSYPELIEEREKHRPRWGKWIGGVVAAWRTMRAAEPLVIVRDGRRARVWSVFIGIGRNDPERVATMQREELETAILDVRIHHARGSRLRAVASLAFGRRTAAVLRALRLMPPREDVERLLVSEFEVTVRPAPLHPAVFVHDGELAEPGGEVFTLRALAVADAVRVFAPPPRGAA